MIIPLLVSNITHTTRVFPSPLLNAYIPSTCHDIDRCRTLSDIVWSCLITVFACIWVGVHPNIMASDSSRFAVFAHRIAIAIVALLIPEGVLAWAIRQYLAAGSLAQKLQDASAELPQVVGGVVNHLREAADTMSSKMTSQAYRDLIEELEEDAHTLTRHTNKVRSLLADELREVAKELRNAANESGEGVEVLEMLEVLDDAVDPPQIAADVANRVSGYLRDAADKVSNSETCRAGFQSGCPTSSNTSGGKAYMQVCLSFKE